MDFIFSSKSDSDSLFGSCSRLLCSGFSARNCQEAQKLRESLAEAEAKIAGLQVGRKELDFDEKMIQR